jgi:Flp pilus assembly protein TadG
VSGGGFFSFVEYPASDREGSGTCPGVVVCKEDRRRDAGATVPGDAGSFMIRKIWKRQEGQSLVEFAIVAPVLLLLLLGIVEFGLILFNQHVITNASREGARFGIVVETPRRTAAEIEAVVDAYCANHLVTFGTGGTPTTSVTFVGQTFGDDLTVEVDFHYDFLVLPNFISTLAGGIDLRADTTMKYE